MKWNPLQMTIIRMALAVVICCFLWNHALGQAERVDQLLEQANDLRAHPVTKTKMVQRALDLAKAHYYQEGQVRSYLMLGGTFGMLNDFAAAQLYVDSAATLARLHNIDQYDQQLWYNRAMIMNNTGQYCEALEYFDQALQMATEKGEVSRQARLLESKATSYTYLGEFDQALQQIDQARILYQSINNQAGLAHLHNSMGLFYHEKGMVGESIEETNKYLSFVKQQKDTVAMISAYWRLVGVYVMNRETENALNSYEQMNHLIQLTEYPTHEIKDINIGILYIDNEEYQKGLDVIRKGYESALEMKDQYKTSLALHWMAIAYRGLDRYDLAADASQKAFEIASAVEANKLAELSAYTLFQTYHWRGRHEEAIKWLLVSNELWESIFSGEKEKEMLELETKYETFRKNQEIALLKAQTEVDRIKKQQLLLGLLATFLLGGLLLYMQWQSRKRDKLIQAEKLKTSRIQQEKLQQQLEFKQRDLTSQVLHITKKNGLLQNILEHLEVMKKMAKPEIRFLLNKVNRLIRADLDASEAWEQFLATFKEVHQEFFQKLTGEFEDLTANDLRLASLMKMNLDSKQIASLLNISDTGIKKARYRLRKKIGLDSEVHLQDYFLNYG